jgi:hypothetical protein
VAHMQITAETIYDSARRNRRLAHELYLVRDKVRRAEARQKARGKFGPRDRRNRVRHALKIRCRLFRPGIERQPIFELTQRRRPPSAGRSRRTTKVLCSFGATVKFKTIVTKPGMRSGPCWKC